MRTISYMQRFGDIELAVRSLGKGIPFVWGHSLMGSMKVEDAVGLWDWPEIETISNVVRYDARGHGNSDGSYEPEDYHWRYMAKDMLAVAHAATDETPWRRSILGGLSMGAATALEAAIQSPESVAGLILVLPPTAWETRPKQATLYRRLSWVSALFGAAPYHLLGLLPTPSKNDGISRLAMNTAKGLSMANPLQVQAALRGAALSDMPAHKKLRNLNVPTLILAWTGDKAHPVSTAETLAELLPDVRKLVVCDPSDLTDWQSAIMHFIKEVQAAELNNDSE